jgi:hypothetical protein
MASAQVYQDRYAKTEATIAARSREVFAGYRTWRFAHRKRDNHPFFMIDGSPVRGADGVEVVPTYYADLHDCTCPSHQDGHLACKHMRAVRLWFEAVKRGEIAIPRRLTAGDRRVLERDADEVEALDVAHAADALLDAYHAQQARRRRDRYREPERPWWTTPNGGIVWLQEGDRIGPDTEVDVPTSVPVLGCSQPGCEDPRAPHEEWCPRHALVDAF